MKSGTIGILKGTTCISNDAGGTTILPDKPRRVKLTSYFYDYETGNRANGILLDESDIEEARKEGTTGHTPEYYKQYSVESYEKSKQAFETFNPAKVFFFLDDMQLTS